MADVLVLAGPVTSFGALASLIGKTAAISVSSCTSFSATADMSSRAAAILAAPKTGFDASAVLFSGSAALVLARPSTLFSADANLTGASDSRTLSVSDIVRDSMLLWGMENPASAPEFARLRAINDLNAAMQIIWNRAKDRNYWTQQTLSLTFAEGQRTLDLADDIQTVIGPARLANRQPLVPVGSVGEIEDFEAAFLGDMTRERSSGNPVAYYIDRMNQSGSEPAKCVMNVAPCPNVETKISIDVVKEPPRYMTHDICAGTLVPIPHRYCEILLIPIVRYLASSCHLFIANDQKKTIDDGFAMASQQLEMADPLPGMDGDNQGERKASAKK